MNRLLSKIICGIKTGSKFREKSDSRQLSVLGSQVQRCLLLLQKIQKEKNFSTVTLQLILYRLDYEKYTKILEKLSIFDLIQDIKLSDKVMFCSSHFSLLVFDHFWRQSYENKKWLRNLCLHFARQDGKKGKKIMQLKWPKYQKPKDKNMGWAKHLFTFCFLPGSAHSL